MDLKGEDFFRNHCKIVWHNLIFENESIVAKKDKFIFTLCRINNSHPKWRELMLLYFIERRNL